MLTPREATEAPRQWSRSPFSPTEVTESATVLVFLILSALLCSVNNADLKTATWLLYCLRLRSRSPHNAQHSTSIIYIYTSETKRDRGRPATSSFRCALIRNRGGADKQLPCRGYRL